MEIISIGLTILVENSKTTRNWKKTLRKFATKIFFIGIGTGDNLVFELIKADSGMIKSPRYLTQNLLFLNQYLSIKEDNFEV